ncbi:MAG: RHO alpha subunit C-terminal catalytic domain-containing protein, partial [Candidatus Binatia bacterium]
IDVAANWKLTVEAQLEAYHVNTIHQTTAARFLDQRAMTASLLGRGHSRFFVGYHNGIHFQYPHPYFPQFDDVISEGSFSYTAFPNLVTINAPNMISAMTFWPLSASTIRYDMHYIGAAPFKDPEHAGMGRQINLNTVIFQEDLSNLPSMQASIAAGVIDHVRFGYQECRLYYLHEEIDRRIGLHLIPKDLRVTQVLDGWVER